MPIDNESYIKRNSLPISEQIRLGINDFRFHSYSEKLRNFQVTTGSIPVDISGLPEPVGTPDNPLDKDELFLNLTDTLRSNGYQKEEIDKLRSIYEFADNKFKTTPGREKRKSGDDYITHSLWMANFLAINGITDIDVQMATILHDVVEDTPTTLEEIELISNKKTAELVDIVSKIKTEKLYGDDLASQKIVKQDQKATQEKILEALEKDPRAILIKAVDVIHNQMTSAYVGDNVREAKGKIAIEFYEKLVRWLGNKYFADAIGNYALRSLQKQRYEDIKAIKEASDARFIPHLQHHINSWVEPETYEGQELTADVIEIESPSIYQIHQSLKSQEADAAEKHCKPTVKITCSSESELHKWHRFLNKKFQEQNLSQNIDPNLNSLTPITENIDLNLDGEQENINIVLATGNMLIRPTHLFINNVSLNPDEHKIAADEFDSFRNAYRQAILEGDITEQMVEVAERGTVDVFDLGKNPHAPPTGSTALDLAYIIGKNLGNDAYGVLIYESTNGNLELIPGTDLKTILKSGMKVEILTTKRKNTITTDRYDSVTTRKAITNIRERASLQIRNWMKRNKKSEDVINEVQDSLSGGKIIPNIGEKVGIDYSDLQRKKEKNIKLTTKEEFIQNARDRGVKIISEIYGIKRGKNLDSHIIDVFTDEQEADFGNFNDFLVNVGLTPIPLREGEYTDRWISEAEPKHQSVVCARNIADRLINYRDGQQTLNMNIEDREGILESVGKITAEKEVDVQIRSAPDNYSYGRKTIIELRFVVGDFETVKEITEELKKQYGESVVIITIEKQK